jgi:hypothetical protein
MAAMLAYSSSSSCCSSAAAASAPFAVRPNCHYDVLT